MSRQITTQNRRASPLSGECDVIATLIGAYIAASSQNFKFISSEKTVAICYLNLGTRFSMKTSRILTPMLCALSLACSVAGAIAGPESPGTNETSKTCFQCNGTGTSKCNAPTCLNGQVDCPAPCIKLRKGRWVKRPDLNRPDPNETMQTIIINGDKWDLSSHHEGVRYVPRGDKEIEMVTCTVCNGTTRVQCKVCQGKGIITCPVCDGKKVVPETWSAFDNPKMKNRPSRFKLKDGSVIVGFKKMAAGSTVIIRTEKGDEKLDAGNIVSEEKQPTQK